MNDPETRGRNPQSVDKRHLSVTIADPKGSRSASASSTHTTITPNPEFVEERPTMQRSGTQVASVEKLSWWDLLMGIFFGPNRLKQELAARIRIPPPEDAGKDMFYNKGSPFSLVVCVFPCPGSQVAERQEAKCMFDTGCYQGNLISATLARSLGFTEFLALEDDEEEGGVAASGHTHHVSGAVRVSWYHNTSAKVFRNMRFLVSESAEVDLVIGTHSIVRHRLIAPPNLGVTDLTKKNNPTREDLVQVVRNLETDVEDTESGAKHEQKKTELEIAKLEVDLYDENEKKKKLSERIEKLSKKWISSAKKDKAECEIKLQEHEKTASALKEKKKKLETELQNSLNRAGTGNSKL